MKTILTVLVVLGLAFCFKKPGDKSAEKPQAEQSSRGFFGAKTVVIKFGTPAELIEKLRPIAAGTKIELRPDSSPQMIATGLRCDDKAGIAAYEAQMRVQRAQEDQIISAELLRITGGSIRWGN